MLVGDFVEAKLEVIVDLIVILIGGVEDRDYCRRILMRVGVIYKYYMFGEVIFMDLEIF